MKTLQQFELTIAGRQTIQMPQGAEVLPTVSVLAHGAVAISAITDNQAKRVRRAFVCARTGDPMPADAGAFLGSANVYGGTQILHVFDCGEQP